MQISESVSVVFFSCFNQLESNLKQTTMEELQPVDCVLWMGGFGSTPLDTQQGGVESRDSVRPSREGLDWLMLIALSQQEHLIGLKIYIHVMLIRYVIIILVTNLIYALCS